MLEGGALIGVPLIDVDAAVADEDTHHLLVATTGGEHQRGQAVRAGACVWYRSILCCGAIYGDKPAATASMRSHNQGREIAARLR